MWWRSSPPAATAAATSCSWGICRRSMASGRSSSAYASSRRFSPKARVRELILATNSDRRGRGHGALPERARRAARHPRQPHRARRAGGRGARVRRRRHAGARARRPAVAVRPARPHRSAVCAASVPASRAAGGARQLLAQAAQPPVALVAPRVQRAGLCRGAHRAAGSRMCRQSLNRQPGASCSTSTKPRLRSSSAATRRREVAHPGESMRAAPPGRSNMRAAVVVCRPSSSRTRSPMATLRPVARGAAPARTCRRRTVRRARRTRPAQRREQRLEPRSRSLPSS